MSVARNLPYATTRDGGPIHNLEADDDSDDDAYNATTKVGAGAHLYTEHLLREAQEMERAHQVSRGAPVWQERTLSVPKPARRSSAPVPAATAAARPAPAAASPIPVVFDDGEEGDLFDPTALFGRPTSGHTVRLDAAMMQSQVAPFDSRNPVSALMRSHAPWTRGPTLPASAFGFRVAPPDSPYALAAVLEPAVVPTPRARPRLLEVLAFVLAFGLVIGLALYAYSLVMM